MTSMTTTRTVTVPTSTGHGARAILRLVGLGGRRHERSDHSQRVDVSPTNGPLAASALMRGLRG